MLNICITTSYFSDWVKLSRLPRICYDLYIDLSQTQQKTEIEEIRMSMVVFFGKLRGRCRKRIQPRNTLGLNIYLFTSERCQKGVMKKLFATGVLAILVKQRNDNSELEEWRYRFCQNISKLSRYPDKKLPLVSFLVVALTLVYFLLSFCHFCPKYD